MAQILVEERTACCRALPPRPIERWIRMLRDLAARIEIAAHGPLADEAVTGLVRNGILQLTGEVGRDSAWLSDQILLWHREAPEHATALTMAALAEHASALRRAELGKPVL